MSGSCIIDAISTAHRCCTFTAPCVVMWCVVMWCVVSGSCIIDAISTAHRCCTFTAPCVVSGV